MNVHLGETWTTFIEGLVSTGEYQNNSEVIREALRLMKERQQLKELRLEEVKRAVQAGLDELDSGLGETISGADHLAAIKRRAVKPKTTTKKRR